MSSPRVVVGSATVQRDALHFPHIIDAILAATAWKDLYIWRLTSRSIRDQIDRMMTSHVIATALYPDDPSEGLDMTSPPNRGAIPGLLGYWFEPSYDIHYPGSRITSYALLNGIRTLDVYPPVSGVVDQLEGIGNSPFGETFKSLQCLRFHPRVLADYSHDLSYHAPTKVVIFGEVACVEWYDSTVPTYTYSIRVLPGSRPLETSRPSKLVVNILYHRSSQHNGYEDEFFEDRDLIPTSLSESVIVFSNWGPWTEKAPRDWSPSVLDGLPPSTARRLSLVDFIIRVFLNSETARVTIVDLQKPDFEWMFKGMSQDGELSERDALTRELHTEINYLETGYRTEDYNYLATCYRAADHAKCQLLRSLVDNVEYLTLSEYGERIGATELRLERHADPRGLTCRTMVSACS